MEANVQSLVHYEIPNFREEYSLGKKHEYCVVIFVINEGEKLHKQLKRMQACSFTADVIISDGGSTDGSTDIRELQALGVNTLLVKEDTGKLGSQMRIAFSWALERGYKGVVVIDGNNKDSVENISDFIARLDQGYDHIQGSRFVPGGKAINTPAFRLVGLKLLHVPMMRIASGFRYTDTTNGYRAYSSKLLLSDELSIFRPVFTGYELHYYMAVEAARNGFKCTEIPVTRAYPRGKVPTKISPVKGNLNVIKKLWLACVGYYRV